MNINPNKTEKENLILLMQSGNVDFQYDTLEIRDLKVLNNDIPQMENIDSLPISSNTSVVGHDGSKEYVIEYRRIHLPTLWSKLNNQLEIEAETITEESMLNYVKSKMPFITTSIDLSYQEKSITLQAKSNSLCYIGALTVVFKDKTTPVEEEEELILDGFNNPKPNLGTLTLQGLRFGQ